MPKQDSKTTEDLPELVQADIIEEVGLNTAPEFYKSLTDRPRVETFASNGRLVESQLRVLEYSKGSVEPVFQTDLIFQLKSRYTRLPVFTGMYVNSSGQTKRISPSMVNYFYTERENVSTIRVSTDFDTPVRGIIRVLDQDLEG